MHTDRQQSSIDASRGKEATQASNVDGKGTEEGTTNNEKHCCHGKGHVICRCVNGLVVDIT
jgi:hypothetical protein